MIIKSMSRKVPSFGQLLGYIDRDQGQEDFTLRHNLLGRDHDSIRAEFERNAELLQKRKNGTYLFHEIISITRAQGLSPKEQKQRLHKIAREYIAARCPGNLVYGGLHQDKDHSYHMHLMISANRANEMKRQRLSKHQFRDIQVKLEAYVLQTYPELEQKVAIGKKSERGRKKGEAELERRTGQRPKREEILERVSAAYEASKDRDSLFAALGREGLELYARGKTVGVVDLESGKKHRLKTLDLQVADQIELRLSGQEASKGSEAKVENEIEKSPAGEKEEQGDTQREADEPKVKRAADKGQGEDMSQDRDDNLKKPSPERQEDIDKGNVQPDPERDLMGHDEWKNQDTGLNKMQQSWRRTMDDLRGRTKDQEDRAKGKGDGGRKR
jgi:hypothetical protein